jgi:sec-independent protein translocase protein TatB
MFDIGWTEMLVIAVVMIVVVGPKDLPKMLRTFGKTTAKLRAMAGDFQKQFNEALKEAELDDVKKSVDELRGLNPASQIRKQLNPFEKAAADVRAGLDAALKPSKPPEAAAAAAQAAEPLKNGATAVPGVSGPETMPPPPVMTPLNGAANAAQPAAEAQASEPLKNGPAAMPATSDAPQSAVAPRTGAAVSQPAAAESIEAKPAGPKRAARTSAAKASNGESAPAKAATKQKAPAKPKPPRDPADKPAARKSKAGAA